MCGGRDRFSVNTKKQIFNCRGCGKSGDIIALVQALDGSDFKTAVETLTCAPRKPAAGGHGGPGRHTHGPANEATDDEGLRAGPRRVWNEAGPIEGTLAARYLCEQRGLALDEDLSHCVRFHARTGWREGDENSPVLRVPCLIAAYRQIDGDEIVAVQKTRLATDGSKLARRMYGPVKGAAIKIDRDEDCTYGLTVGEGLETSLASRVLGFRPCWALGSAVAIERFPVLAGIAALTLLAETDDNGANKKAIDACARRWLDAGREVLFATPGFKGDMNDVVRGEAL